MRAISVPIFMILMFILIVAILVPAYLVINSTQIYSQQGSQQATGYLQAQSQEVNQVFRGNPNVYFNSSNNPYLEIFFTSSPYPFNITGIYYFNGSTWKQYLNNSIVVAGDTNLQLPSKAFNEPVLLISGQANIYFLNPNTSINTVNLQGPSGKFPVYIASFVINGTKLLPVSVNVGFGTQSAITPSVFYVLPGTYPVLDNNYTVFLPQYGLTGVFQNWTVIGGTLSSPNSVSTTATIYSPTVIVAFYKAYTNTYKVLIQPWNIPLGHNDISNNGVTLCPLNQTMNVVVDNKSYTVGSSGITLDLTYGYHIIQFPSYFNISFNYIGGNFNELEGGQITTYELSGLLATKGIKVFNDVVFVNSSGTIKGNYKPVSNYFLVEVKNDFCLPAGYGYKNSTPFLGNIAGQLLEVCVGNTGQVIVLGPTENFVPEKIYFKQGTSLTITLDYLHPINGMFSINNQNYNSLVSQPYNVTVTNSTSSNYPYYPQPHQGYYGTIYINSPTIIINYQEWRYGGQIL
ncbi:hypothetical protein [Metallosphaera cuprina]|uniref:Uncharacterized protein n=1 Tax=Metallosphaera cuprina (strain Ar-4) TaxID=1006006 RepID=F4G102_METCR|nr:hypothetical protein [Metallosphaera cuprina]AEB94692.1 conserved hypothetical protein [Metallosphaera cuprina Ar-4]